MMRRFVLSVVAVAVCAGFALAQEGQAPEKKASKPAAAASKKAPKAKAAASKTETGIVEAVDVAANKLTVKDNKGKTQDFVIEPEVQIKKGMESLTLSQLTQGEKVTVSYEKTADQPKVKSVKVHVAKAPAGKKSQKAATEKPAEKQQ